MILHDTLMNRYTSQRVWNVDKIVSRINDYKKLAFIQILSAEDRT